MTKAMLITHTHPEAASEAVLKAVTLVTRQPGGAVTVIFVGMSWMSACLTRKSR